MWYPIEMLPCPHVLQKTAEILVINQPHGADLWLGSEPHSARIAAQWWAVPPLFPPRARRAWSQAVVALARLLPGLAADEARRLLLHVLPHMYRCGLLRPPAGAPPSPRPDAVGAAAAAAGGGVAALGALQEEGAIGLLVDCVVVQLRHLRNQCAPAATSAAVLRCALPGLRPSESCFLEFVPPES